MIDRIYANTVCFFLVRKIIIKKTHNSPRRDSNSHSHSHNNPKLDPVLSVLLIFPKKMPHSHREAGRGGGLVPLIRDPENIEFRRILSENTHYSVVWKGKYRKQPCVIKMIALQTGLHFHKSKERYVVGEQELKVSPKLKKASQSDLEKYFTRDAKAPFLHTRFKGRKSMGLKLFNHEARAMAELAQHQHELAPKVLGTYVATSPDSPVHYGFLVVEQADCTLKDVILKRDPSKEEMRRAHRLLEQLHDAGYVHGDCKPSNVGVWLDCKQQITRMGFLDCMKVKSKRDLDSSTWKARKRRDTHTFDKHHKKNIGERL